MFPGLTFGMAISLTTSIKFDGDRWKYIKSSHDTGQVLLGLKISKVDAQFWIYKKDVTNLCGKGER